MSEDEKAQKKKRTAARKMMVSMARWGRWREANGQVSVMSLSEECALKLDLYQEDENGSTDIPEWLMTLAEDIAKIYDTRPFSSVRLNRPRTVSEIPDVPDGKKTIAAYRIRGKKGSVYYTLLRFADKEEEWFSFRIAVQLDLFADKYAFSESTYVCSDLDDAHRDAEQSAKKMCSRYKIEFTKPRKLRANQVSCRGLKNMFR